MTLPNWKAIPVRTKRSRRRLHNLIADEFNLDSWNELPNPIKRSKRKLFNYYAEELHLEEFKELLKQEVRSTREYYIYLKENANPSSAPTLTITVKSGESNVSGASVTIGSTTKSTGSDGKTTFTLDYDDYLVEVSKNGYADLEENIKFRANHKSFTLNIEATGGDTGTVTVTCKDESENLLDGADVGLLEVGGTQPFAYGTTNSNGVTTLTLMDMETHEPTGVTDIPFGTYVLVAEYKDAQEDIYMYQNNLTVDGDENVIATLTLDE